MGNVRKALREYGYMLSSGRWVHSKKGAGTQSWEETTGGLLRFDDGSIPVPYKVKPEFEGVGGLDFHLADHAPCFNWIWPAEYVERMYVDAWEARKAYIERKAAEKGQPILEAIREARPEFTAEVAAAIAAEVAKEKKSKRRWFR